MGPSFLTNLLTLQTIVIFIFNIIEKSETESASITNAIDNILGKFTSHLKCSITLKIFGVKSLHDFDKVSFSILHQNYVPIQIPEPDFPAPSSEEISSITKQQYLSTVKQATKLTRHFGNCEGAIFDTDSFVVPKNFSSKGDLLDGARNTGPFFFLGSEPKLSSFIITKPVQKIKWRFSVAHIINNEIEIRILSQRNRKLVGTNIDFISNLKSKFEGVHFPCTTIAVATFVAWNSEKQPFMGTFYNAISAASKAYNFTFSINLPPGSLNRYPNGTWPGAAGDVLYNGKEIILGFGHTLERAEAVEFSPLFGFIQLIFFKPHPRVGIHLWALVYSYTKIAWALITIVLGLFWLLITLGLWFSNENPQLRRRRVISFEMKESSRFKLTFKALWILHHVIFEQSQRFSRHYRIKFVLILSLFFSFIIGFGYKTNLISNLTFPSYQKLPCTFNELANDLAYKIGFSDIKGSGMVFLNTSTSPTIMKISNRVITDDNRLRCTMNVVLKQDFICLEFEHVGRSEVNRNLTLRRSVSVVDRSSESAFFIPIALGYPRSYKFYQEFNSILSFLRDTGHYQKWVEELTEFEITVGIEWLMNNKDTLIFQKLDHLSRSEGAVEPFSFENVALSFYSLFAGLLISIIWFLSEKPMLWICNTREKILTQHISVRQSCLTHCYERIKNIFRPVVMDLKIQYPIFRNAWK